jgi:acyl-coenzyme A thioesterase PaaI-like protein
VVAADEPHTDAQIEVRRRLADATRVVVERLVASAAPVDLLTNAAERMESFGDLLGGYPYGRTYKGYAEPANAPRPQEFFDHSPLSGKANPLAPPMRLEVVDDVVHGRVRFGAAYEGPPGCVHGGFVAAVFDEILGMANSLSGEPGMTGTLSVKYRKPTPLRVELRLEATLDRVDGRKRWCSARLHAGDVLCGEAEGLFIAIGLERFKDLLDRREKPGATPSG